jgi:phage-related protein
MDKPLYWLHGTIGTPPMSVSARRESGYLLRELQKGETLSPPFCKPMPSIGLRCYELRVQDENVTWRIVVRIDPDLILVTEVFAKKTQKTTQAVIDACKKRLRAYDAQS